METLCKKLHIQVQRSGKRWEYISNIGIPHSALFMLFWEPKHVHIGAMTLFYMDAKQACFLNAQVLVTMQSKNCL